MKKKENKKRNWSAQKAVNQKAGPIKSKKDKNALVCRLNKATEDFVLSYE